MFPWQKFYNGWLDSAGITAAKAAKILKIGVMSSYNYRNGVNAPSVGRMPQLGHRLGLTEKKYIGLLASDARARRLERKA